MMAPSAVPDFLHSPPGYGQGAQVRFIRAEGTGRNGILLCGEAGGEQEAKTGLPFRPEAEAGSVLERVFYRSGIKRGDCTVTNLVPYRPPRNWLEDAPWEMDAIALGRKYLDALVARVQPKVIVALGGLAMRELTGLSGDKAGIGMTRGFIVPALNYRTHWEDDGTFEGKTIRTELPTYSGVPVVGTFHPSFLRRGSKERESSGPKGKTKAAGGGTSGGMALLGVMIRDLLLAQKVAKDGVPTYTHDDFRLGATLDDWEWFLREAALHPEWPLMDDFETIDSIVASDETEFEVVRRDPTQFQMSMRKGQAVVSPWREELKPIIQKIKALPNPKGDWNGRKFDRLIHRDLGIRTDVGGPSHDLMDLAHHAQPDLPRGLQFNASFHVPQMGPWKHLSHSDPLWYGALDVDSLQYIWCGLKSTLSEVRHPVSGISLWSGYIDQVVRLAPVLDRMSARGIPVDESKRQKLDAEFTATLNRISAECQGMYPEGIKGVHSYKRAPKEAELGARTTLRMKSGEEMVEVETVWTQRAEEIEVKCGCEWGKNVRQRGKILAERSLEDCVECGNSGKLRRTELLWAKVEPFLPGSWQQKLRYIEFKREEDLLARAKKYLLKHPGEPEAARFDAEHRTEWVIPLDYKTRQPTTAADELVRLGKRTGDPLLPLVVEYAEVSKMRGTYVRGWKPGADGRVHTNFNFKPATGQLSSSDPVNAQNFPAHGTLAEAMKRMIVSAADLDGAPCP